MKPFELVGRSMVSRGPTLWTTPEDGKIFELQGADPNTATLWAYHLHLEPDRSLTEPDVEGWMQITPPTMLHGEYGARVRERDAPVPPWEKLGETAINN